MTYKFTHNSNWLSVCPRDARPRTPSFAGNWFLLDVDYTNDVGVWTFSFVACSRNRFLSGLGFAAINSLQTSYPDALIPPIP